MTQEQQDKQAEDREAFYMQYFGQFVLTAIDRDINKIGCGVSIYNMSLLLDGTFSNHYLELKPLSAITDEDALEVARILDINHSGAVEDVKEWLNDGHGFSRIKHKWECLEIFDYLRSLGYLLPFRQFSTQQLLDMGWAKI